MEYRNLGRTGVKVSKLCLGTMMFARKTGEAESIEIVERALDAGINFIDTANIYSAGEGGLRTDGRERSARARLEPQARHRGVRGVPQTAQDRLDRSLSASPPGVRYPDRRDAACARRPDPRRQGALYRHEHVLRVEDRRGALGLEGVRRQPL